MRSLSFIALRAANVRRCPQFKNALGMLSGGADWSVADWFVALTGEVGELGNYLKKIKRGDFLPADMERVGIAIAKELADVQIYLDLLAWKLNVDLGRATIAKFNEVSDRVECPVFLYGSMPRAWFRQVADCVVDQASVVFHYGTDKPHGDGWEPLYD